MKSPGLGLGFGLSDLSSQAQAQLQPILGPGLAGLKWAGLG
jgi:hypothetical protein